MRLRWIWPWAAGLLCALPCLAQERVLTIDEALALARERAADVALARGRVEEARARQTQAGRRFQENPELEVNGGYRHAEDDYFDFDAALTQSLYGGRRRDARLAGAQAALDRAEAELAEVRRRLLRDVWTAFGRVLAAQTRAVLVSRSREAADALLAATERRYEAGEATALELNRARIAAAGARAEQGGGGGRRERGARRAEGAARAAPWRVRRGPRAASLPGPPWSWKPSWRDWIGGRTSSPWRPSCGKPRPRCCWARPSPGPAWGCAAAWPARRGRTS